jgi:PEP-CTERM motif
MKKVLLAAALVLGAGNIFASPVQCTPNQGDFLNNGVGTATVFTCSPSAAAGNIAGDGLNVISISFLVAGTAQETGGPAATLLSASLSVTNNAGLTNPGGLNFSCTTDSNGACVSGPLSTSQSTAVGPVDQFGAFTVTVTGLAGSPSLANGTAAVFYQAVTATSGVPEPTTFALMGAGILGLGLVGRRRSAKK